MKRLSVLEWYHVLRLRHQWTVFQAIRYALWLACYVPIILLTSADSQIGDPFSASRWKGPLQERPSIRSHLANRHVQRTKRTHDHDVAKFDRMVCL